MKIVQKISILTLVFAAYLYAARVEELTTMIPTSFAPLIDSASKSVVYIMTAEDTQAGVATPFAQDAWFRPYFLYPQLGLSSQKLRRSLGSGVIISSKGIIVTSARFIEDKKAVKVVVPNYPEPFDAKVLGADLSADIAILKIIAENLPQPAFANVAKLESGTLLFAIGNPFGLEPVVSMGIVSTVVMQYDDDRLLQSDLFIHGGNIGGAIIDTSGDIVGIPVRLRGMDGKENQGGYFLPIDRVVDIARRIERSGSVKEAWLGIAVADLTQEMRSYFGRDDGIVVTAVEPFSPAANAGVRKGDILLLADNIAVGSVLDFERILSTMIVDRDVVLLYMRDQHLGEVALRVGRLENSALSGARSLYHQGMVLETLTQIWKERLDMGDMNTGIVVVDVERNSVAEKSGFLAGDVIVQAEEVDQTSLNSFQSTLLSKQLRKFLVMRGGIIITLELAAPIADIRR